MDATLVLTAIGDDRPGLVEELATQISAFGGNWLESSMAQLGGKFAGIVRVSVPAPQLPALRSALDAFRPLTVICALAEAEAPAQQTLRSFSLSLVGHDRVGIVREVAQVLARHAVNVETLNTYTSAAPMSGETLFHAEADLHAGAGLDESALQQELEALSAELVVDIKLSTPRH